MSKPLSEAAIEASYQSSFGRAAGYLPRDRTAVDAWQAALVKRARAQLAMDHVKPVQELADLLDREKDLQVLVTRTIDEALKMHPDGVRNIDEMLTCLDEITQTAPHYRLDPRQRIYFPMSALFCYMMAVKNDGWELFRDQRFNGALRKILKAWCVFLDSPESRHVLYDGPDGWLSQAAYEDFKLYEFEIDPDAPYGGFASYNAFFHRPIKPEFRPNGALHDLRAVVSPNDGSVVMAYPNVQKDAYILDIKHQRYSLRQLLGKYSGIDAFVGGTVFQSFLSGANYHRWHAPVDGVIEYKETVEGLMFSELYSEQVDPTAGTLSQGYQANVNTRGIVVIKSESPDIGKVCVIPVGITEISSVTITAEVGQRVTRGDEIGYFSYGGSSMCLVFEPNKVDFTVPTGVPGTVTDDGAPIFVNSTIARAT
ncbi:phophatidylserine decarboxylase associated domain-containing protein [Streptomyces sp. NPDC059649]|uniref:phophatidylserine decarboxylase associated domain-containing protein n=1 Tax=Streptomyces sp. NPDC059649 TaxID=3346895 RepID=UPI0036AEA0B4